MKHAAEQSTGEGAPVDSVQVAALFVDLRGPYPGLVGREYCWDEERDAHSYCGPWPVVAHPPCQLWVSFAHVNFARWGGEHNRPGNDGGTFNAALAAVRRWGGVLEHPAFSKAWAAHELVRPFGRGWRQCEDREWVCEVWQNAYGHKARKRTWLFYVGFSPPLELKWARRAATHQIGFHDQRGKARNKPTVSGRAASRTPEDFARTLVRLAQVSGISNGTRGSR